MIKGIEASKEVPFEKVLFALGIRFVGETVAKKLAWHFKSIDALMQASPEELLQVDEIGEAIAHSVTDFFQVTGNGDAVENLRRHGIQLELKQEDLADRTDKLQGKVFVVSGVFSLFSRNELKKSIEDNGGKVTGSISKKTTYVIAGENMGPSKKEKAASLGIPVISESDYVKLIS